VDYDQRLALCGGQELLLSLHSDSRAGTRSWWVDEARGLWANEGAAGYAVLYSDEGPAPLVAQRHRWAQALGLRMAEAGLQPYLGLDYTALYGADEVPGVFVDRHAPSKRIRLLRRPSIPSLIVETHEAHDAADVALWQRPETRSAFASAVALSIADLQAAP
jgi:N-acetylmuramoyl-L-alanine amidase